MSPADTAYAEATALEIADWLCARAWVDGPFATWPSVRRQLDDEGNDTVLTLETIGPDLYDGGTGVALFLAEAWAIARRPRHAEIACAALACALSRQAWIPAEWRLGFHGGYAGLAWVLARCARLLERPEYLREAGRLVDTLVVPAGEELAFDIIGGAAGGIAALLAMQDARPDDRTITTAAGLARYLVHGATKSDSGWSWGDRPSDDDVSTHSSGFAHGAAGIAWSLLALSRATGDGTLREAAFEGFRHVHGCLDASGHRWHMTAGRDQAEESPVSWCHGAAGIGLAYLEARPGRDELASALATVTRHVARGLAELDPGEDLDSSLCHGVPGVAEFLLDAGRALGDAACIAVAHDVSMRAARRHAGRPDTWISGQGGQRDATLMIGLAGIGMHYLRIAHPRIPSVLRCGAGDAQQPT